MQAYPRPVAVALLQLAMVEAGSQGSQDETIALLFKAIGFNALSFEESSGANTEALWKSGWHGLLLDGRNTNASINLHQTFISSENIVDTFKRHKVPKQLDFLSIDLDTVDIWVMESILSHYRPRVFEIEHNVNFDFGQISSCSFPFF